MRQFGDVKFITASQAVRLYADSARDRTWKTADVKQLAAAVGDDPGFQRHAASSPADSYTLSAAEVLAILSRFVSAHAAGKDAPIEYPGSPYGPSSAETSLDAPLTVEGEQF